MVANWRENAHSPLDRKFFFCIINRGLAESIGAPFNLVSSRRIVFYVGVCSDDMRRSGHRASVGRRFDFRGGRAGCGRAELDRRRSARASRRARLDGLDFRLEL